MVIDNRLSWCPPSYTSFPRAVTASVKLSRELTNRNRPGHTISTLTVVTHHSVLSNHGSSRSSQLRLDRRNDSSMLRIHASRSRRVLSTTFASGNALIRSAAKQLATMSVTATELPISASKSAAARGRPGDSPSHLRRPRRAQPRHRLGFSNRMSQPWCVWS